jgi:predicted dehydrogenase
MTTESREIGVGLVGCGHIARAVHLKILARLPGARVVAVAETDAESRAAALGGVPGARGFGDYRDLLEDPATEAVVIALPTGLHAEAAIAAFEAGKHVYLEKPLATGGDDGRAVLSAWRRSSRLGMIGFNYRFNRLFLDAARILASGEMGGPVAVRSIFASAPRELGGWKAERARGGGVLLDLASHHVDLLRFLFREEVADVDCALRSIRTEDDTASLQLRLSGGMFVQSLFSHCAADEDRFEIYCEGGKITVERGTGLAAIASRGRRETRRADAVRRAWTAARNATYGYQKFRAFGHEPSWALAFERFLACVRREEAVSPDLEDGWRSLEVVLAAEEAARSGRRVFLAGTGTLVP